MSAAAMFMEFLTALTSPLEYGAERTDRKSYKERQYKLLADNVRANLDMELIYKILRKEV